MIRGVHHTSITTPDLDRLVGFYRDLLGFEMVLETSWEAGLQAADEIYGLKDTSVRMAMLKTSNAFLELFQFLSPAGRAPQTNRPVCDAGVTHMCLNVDDAEAEYSRLSAAGIRFHTAPRYAAGIGWATYGRDPDGNIFELLQPDQDGKFDQLLPG